MLKSKYVENSLSNEIKRNNKKKCNQQKRHIKMERAHKSSEKKTTNIYT